MALGVSELRTGEGLPVTDAERHAYGYARADGVLHGVPYYAGGRGRNRHYWSADWIHPSGSPWRIELHRGLRRGWTLVRRLRAGEACEWVATWQDGIALVADSERARRGGGQTEASGR